MTQASVRAQLDKCVHCGFCLHDCPTYDLLRDEADSPRGRIALIAAVEENRLEPGPRFAEHITRCVGCLACESACPAGVEYHQLLEHARARIGPQGSPQERAGLTFALRHLLPYPERLRLLATLAKLYQRSLIPRFLEWSGLMERLDGPLARMHDLMPPLPDRTYTPPEWIPAEGKARYRVGLLTGCVMGAAFSDSNRSTVELLQRAGCEIVVPRQQTCCGALSAHNGDPEGALALARRNINAFPEDLDAIIVNAAGCGASMKHYHELPWPDDRERERARRFAARVKDITEFLDAALPDTTIGRLPAQTVTYQDPCHLAHGQGIRLAPRRLLARIEGVTLVEMERSDRCCGSAGIYNVTQPEIADRMLKAKMATIAATGATTVVAPNPGCAMQIAYGAKRYGPPVQVRHLVDLLANAVRDAS